MNKIRFRISNSYSRADRAALQFCENHTDSGVVPNRILRSPGFSQKDFEKLHGLGALQPESLKPF